MPTTETFTLRLGYDRDPVGAAAQAATAEWVAVCERDGWTPAGDVLLAPIPSATLDAMGQVLIEVTGQRSRD